MKNLSVIVPCFNFDKLIAKNINRIIKKISKKNYNYEIIVANDGSKDNTTSEIKKLIKSNKNIRLINFRNNRGKSYVIKYSLRKTIFNNILLIDCDLPYFEYFNNVISKLNKNDLVIINRRSKKSSLKDKKLTYYQWFRGKLGDIIGYIINFLLKLEIEGNDTQAGLKAFKKIHNFNKIKFYSEKWFLDLELIKLYKDSNKKIFCIPVKYELPKESNISFFSLKNFFVLYEFIKILIILKIK
jgi:glycosyltransferase involved in cell wall biosynthesis